MDGSIVLNQLQSSHEPFAIQHPAQLLDTLEIREQIPSEYPSKNDRRAREDLLGLVDKSESVCLTALPDRSLPPLSNSLDANTVIDTHRIRIVPSHNKRMNCPRS